MIGLMVRASTDQTRDVTRGPASTLESNKQTVLAFYELALNNKDFDSADALIGLRYVQHDPVVADDIDGLKGFIGYLRDTFPELRAEVKQIFAEDDFVIAHAHCVRVPGQRGSVIVNIFRLEDGRIVEHWDVIQPIPEEAENANGMF
jgi:predicted SnoaL-like aldol condensation-catalyzing enzyme